MACCLNPDCPNPHNPDGTKFCLSCGEAIIPLLRNHYKVIQLLGQGGFGRTYLAEDIDKLNQPCVVKQLVPNTQGTWAKNKAIELFKLEAQQLQQLGDNHHIPSLYAYFEQEGYLYLVQQFIKGQDLLKELTKKGAWKEAEIKQLLLELLPVLQFIHEQGVIHRDIKPENIMRRQSATKVGNRGDLVLIDFGVSKDLSSTVLKTTVGTRIGSPAYAPIEQMKGGEAYPAGDLFSLGATCFHLLTNIHPYQLFLDAGYSWTNNWQSHLPNKVSNDLVRVMDRLLAKNVEARYQSAQDVIRDLQTPVVSSRSSSYQVPEPTVYSSVPKSKSKVVSKVQRQSQKSKNYASSQGKKNSRKGLIIGTMIALIGFVGYVSFSNTLDTNQEVSWENATLFATLTEHSDYVNSVAFSPDGKILVSSSSDDTIKLWNVETKEVITTLTEHSSDIESVAFSPDGKILASASRDSTIKLWNVETKEVITTLTGHSSDIESVAFSPDGKTLASGSDDNTIKLWNVKTKQVIATFFGRSSDIESVAFSPNSKILAGASRDNTIRLWDVETKQKITTLTGHSSDVESVTFSPDGKILASGSWDDSIKIWDVETKQKIATINELSGVESIAFSPDSKILASSSNKTIKLWDMETKQEIATITGNSSYIESIAFSPDGKILASGSRDGTINLWHIP